MKLTEFGRSITTAVSRARLCILSVAAAYGATVLLGIVMVHSGNSFALAQRDHIVNQAVQQDATTAAAIRGDNTTAAMRDFIANLTLGAMPKTVMGMSIVLPYPWVAYQGWVGGIVSVRGDHSSRMNHPRSAAYYLLTLLLQLVPYSLAVGAGVNVGVAMFRPLACYQDKKWLGLLSREALRDMARIYLLVVPMFLVASLWEFLSPWNQ